jgi:hypothetical protein
LNSYIYSLSFTLTHTQAPTKKKKEVASDSYKVHDTRQHHNIVFIGHVDAGKSTVTGQILLLTGQVDKRTIAKYEREAKEKNRESWCVCVLCACVCESVCQVGAVWMYT